MKILFVINNYYIPGNGISASARRTVKALREAGHEVRLLSGCKPTDSPQPEYPLKEFHFPIFQPIISSQGFCYASSDKRIMEEAIAWADVVHLEEMFVLQWKAIRIANRMGKAITATFHMYPENILASLGMGKWKWANRTLLRAWRKHIYNDCIQVQCPTENVLDRLRRYHFKPKLSVISNGILPDACIRPQTPPDNYLDTERPLDVICISRLSKEKDQTTLLEALRHSQYARRIRLTLAGNGPEAKRYRRISDRLLKDGIIRYPVEFVFLDRQGLRELAARADLAIHCAHIEVEGLSIMEAMQQGAVPIIAEGRYSGTSLFALDRRSIFPVQNPEALAHRIDYWLSNPAERWEMGRKYVRHMEQFDIRKSVEKLLVMFQKAIDEKKGC